MNMITIQALSLTAVGLGGVYLGIAFLNGLLYPQIFAPLYTFSDNMIGRIIIAFPLFFGPSNYLVSKAYEIGGATIGGVGTLIFTLVWMTVMAMVVDHTKLNLWIVAGFLIALLGCFLVVYGIKN